MEYGRKVDCLRPDRAGEEIGTGKGRTSKDALTNFLLGSATVAAAAGGGGEVARRRR